MLDRDPLPAQLGPDRVEVLDAAAHVAGDRVLLEDAADRRADLLDEVPRQPLALVELLAQGAVVLGVELRQRQVLELGLDAADAEPVGDRGVDLERLRGDAAARRLGQEVQRAHVVQAVGELDEDHPQVVDRGEQHAAERLRLRRLARGERLLHGGDLGERADQRGDVLAELLLELRLAHHRVLEQVVEQAGGDRDLVEPHLGEDVRHLQRVDQVRLARDAQLAAVRARGVQVGAAQQPLVAARVVGLDEVEDILEARQRLGHLFIVLGGQSVSGRHGGSEDLPRVRRRREARRSRNETPPRQRLDRRQVSRGCA